MNELKISMKPVHKKSLYLKIADSIYSYIQMNNLKAGDKLPSERDMSAMLQTSRNSVREALRVLEDRGLIEVKTGRGVFLKDPYGNQNTMQIKLSNCKIKEIQELQSCLDHQAVQNSIDRATAEEKEALISVAAEMVKLAKENVYSHILDHNFHTKLYASGHNSAIEQLIIHIRNERFVQQEDSEAGNDSIWLKTIPQHLTLAQAIQNMDAQAAKDAIDEINSYGFQFMQS